ncbi:MAG: alpha-glucan family phosphorylase, partial [Gammaproteobacteria bacterium]|nr:alpha-glucan family phosphorylase [Gammaproteobacteria bacterium]
ISLETCTLGFARRMTSYKRPDLLFTDIERIKNICKHFPLQIILAGKAHPLDQQGKVLIRQLHEYIVSLSGAVRVIYVQNYDMCAAQYLTSGVDIWLNTPMPPMEASGTSGIKAAFNGVPHLSALDGWWLEGHIEDITGWCIDTTDTQQRDAIDLYNKLEQIILPKYYDNRNAWIQIMKNVMSKNTRFNSHGMMRRYAAEAYLR